jgi:hypothetical protein
LSGLRGEDSIAELCRKEGIAQSLYYSWSKEFFEAGKKRLAGDAVRQANTCEVKGLRAEALALKELVGVIPPFLTGCICRTYAAIFSFCAGVMPPMPMFGRSLL